MKKPRSIGDLVARNMDAVLQKRAGLKGELIAQWPTIVGSDLAGHCRPVTLKWPKPLRNAVTDEDVQEPASLVVSASGIWALRVQHSTGELIERINRFFGYHAVGRIRIEQKEQGAGKSLSRQRVAKAPTHEQARAVDAIVNTVDDPQMRETLRKLGRAIKADQSRQ